MGSSLSNILDNLGEGIHRVKFKDCNGSLEYKSVNNNLINYKYSSYHKNYWKKDWWKFKKVYSKTQLIKLSNGINKYILLLRKGVCPYEFVDNWEKFHETSYQKKRVL